MHRPLRITFPALLLSSVMFSGFAGAQSAAPAPVQAQAPAPAPANTNPIRIGVFVSDKLGHPIHGLTQQDFTVLDNGQPVQVTDFRAFDSSANPNVSSVLIMVDMINNDAVTVEREREQINQFLGQDNGRLAHPVSIAALTETGVKMMHGYSQDGNALLENFKQMKSEIRPVGASAGFYGAAERMQISLTLISQVAAQLGKLPGRKLVVVIGPGWALLPQAGIQEGDKQRQWVFNTLVQMTNQLRESNVVFYVVDPFFLGRSDPFYYKSYLKPVKKVDQAEFPYLSLQGFAEHSGGLTLMSGNDVAGSISAVLRDAGGYYELVFNGLPADRQNELHTLQVKTTRPDATARTNAFYYAKATPLGNGKTVPPEKATEPDMGLHQR